MPLKTGKDKELSLVYNRLQEAHKTIGTLVELLEEARKIMPLSDEDAFVTLAIDKAIDNYGDTDGS